MLPACFLLASCTSLFLNTEEARHTDYTASHPQGNRCENPELNLRPVAHNTSFGGKSDFVLYRSNIPSALISSYFSSSSFSSSLYGIGNEACFDFTYSFHLFRVLPCFQCPLGSCCKTCSYIF